MDDTEPRPQLTDERLTEWQRLAEGATPGPWSAADEHGLIPGATPAWCVSRMDGEKYLYDIVYMASDDPPVEADAEFIAAAREAVPALIAEVGGSRARIAELLDWKLGEHDALVAELRKARAELAEVHRLWQKVSAYDSDQLLCRRCGNGYPMCADGFPHSETCGRYRWARDVCADCEAQMAAEADHLGDAS